MADNKQHKKRKQLLIAGAVIILAVLLYDLSPFGGNIRFYVKWAQCGSRPVETAGLPGINWYQEAPIYAPIRTQVWYCTPLEAEQAGYSASATTWTFPHLHKN